MRLHPPTSSRAEPRAEAHALKAWASAPCLLLLALLLSACATPQQSTRMTVDDFDAMAAEMAASLADSEALAQRSPDSEPWVISIERVLNLTSDVMTQSEQWSIIARLRSSTPLRSLADDKNVRFVMAPDRVVALREELVAEGEQGEAFGSERLTPTHTMTATFRSMTRAHTTGRTELYYCEFEILEHATSVPVWIDRFEYKREAHGHIWD
ncbi:hypothetical protein ACERK3_00820 [Phycisphaerales bacterium AB-hyl4]|uniref:Uncharacterized protein n=1 Tax=Natronomicrosphaera hydrolytica TaxID=3242702 RepID=A0ABV4U1S8_9BACT